MNVKKIGLIIIPVVISIFLVVSYHLFFTREIPPTPTATPSPIASPTPTPSPTQSPKLSPSPTPIPTSTSTTTTPTQTLTPFQTPTPTPIPTPTPKPTPSPVTTLTPAPTHSTTPPEPTPTGEEPNPKMIYREGQVVIYYDHKGGFLVGVYIYQYFRNDGGPGNVSATLSFKCHESDGREDVWSKVFFMEEDEEVKAVAHVSISAGCAVFKDFNCCLPVHPTPPEEKLFYYTWAVRQTEPSDEDIGAIKIERNV